MCRWPSFGPCPRRAIEKRDTARRKAKSSSIQSSSIRCRMSSWPTSTGGSEAAARYLHVPLVRDCIRKVVIGGEGSDRESRQRIVSKRRVGLGNFGQIREGASRAYGIAGNVRSQIQGVSTHCYA